MASLTKLRRRLLEWERYATRIGFRFGDRWHREQVGGLDRAADRFFTELARQEEAAAARWPAARDPWGAR
jgi:hypothetical protein